MFRIYHVWHIVPFTFNVHSCKASLTFTELFNVLGALILFYTSSTKRLTSLQESVQVLEVDNPLNLSNVSKTLWTARAESITSV